MVSLEQLENFMRLLHAVQNVERVARIPGDTSHRNTAEHTFELTMLCWYINSVNNLNLDTEKILRYALSHDLIEAYAGDTYIYDTEARKDKVERETKALKQLTENFQEFPELIATIHEYEARENAESKFVYAVDKLIDPFDCSMDIEQSFFKEKNVSYKQLREYKDPKIALSDDVAPYWKEICKKFENNKDFFFDE